MLPVSDYISELAYMHVLHPAPVDVLVVVCLRYTCCDVSIRSPHCHCMLASLAAHVLAVCGRLLISNSSWLLDMIAAACCNRRALLHTEVWTGAFKLALLVGSGSQGNSSHCVSKQWWAIEKFHLKEKSTTNNQIESWELMSKIKINCKHTFDWIDGSHIDNWLDIYDHKIIFHWTINLHTKIQAQKLLNFQINT